MFFQCPRLAVYLMVPKSSAEKVNENKVIGPPVRTSNIPHRLRDLSFLSRATHRHRSPQSLGVRRIEILPWQVSVLPPPFVQFRYVEVEQRSCDHPFQCQSRKNLQTGLYKTSPGHAIKQKRSQFHASSKSR